MNLSGISAYAGLDPLGAAGNGPAVKMRYGVGESGAEGPGRAVVLDISRQAREQARDQAGGAKGAAQAAESAESESGGSLESRKSALEKAIERINKEIERIEASDLPKEEKDKRLALLRSQLADMNSQLLQLAREEAREMAKSQNGAFYATGSLT